MSTKLTIPFTAVRFHSFLSFVTLDLSSLELLPFVDNGMSECSHTDVVFPGYAEFERGEDSDGCIPATGLHGRQTTKFAIIIIQYRKMWRLIRSYPFKTRWGQRAGVQRQRRGAGCCAKLHIKYKSVQYARFTIKSSVLSGCDETFEIRMFKSSEAVSCGTYLRSSWIDWCKVKDKPFLCHGWSFPVSSPRSGKGGSRQILRFYTPSIVLQHTV